MRFTAYDADEGVIATRDYYSVGGGFVVNQDDAADDRIVADETPLPYPFLSGDELLAQCARSGLSIAVLMFENEKKLAQRRRDPCGPARGMEGNAVLRGARHPPRRHPAWRPECLAARTGAVPRAVLQPEAAMRDPLTTLDWVNLYALAVNEENAAGGRVVTAPTNGAAGIIPAVLHYFDRFCAGASEQRIFDFLLTAAAIGILYKEKRLDFRRRGRLPGVRWAWPVRWQLAAWLLRLAATRGRSKNAAEIGMEHNLGLTCDPIGGLVQIPCIERNAMGAVKAINASRMAMRGDGKHKVSLDKVIKTMRDTGRDMQDKYKETSRGGLAVNVIEC